MKFTTWGRTLGSCRHSHPSEAKAADCAGRHRLAMARRGMYSDREVFRVEQRALPAFTVAPFARDVLVRSDGRIVESLGRPVEFECRRNRTHAPALDGGEPGR